MVYQGPSRGCNSCRRRRKKVRYSSNSYRPILNSVKTFLLSSVTRRVQYVEIFIPNLERAFKSAELIGCHCPRADLRSWFLLCRQRLNRRAPVVLEVNQGQYDMW